MGFSETHGLCRGEIAGWIKLDISWMMQGFCRCKGGMTHAQAVAITQFTGQQLPFSLTSAVFGLPGTMMRNQVDYSPYAPADLASRAMTALDDATALLTACRDDLQNRGVRL